MYVGRNEIRLVERNKVLTDNESHTIYGSCICDMIMECDLSMEKEYYLVTYFIGYIDNI